MTYIQYPELTWYEEKTSSCKLSSDLHKYAIPHVYPHTNKCKEEKVTSDSLGSPFLTINIQVHFFLLSDFGSWSKYFYLVLERLHFITNSFLEMIRQSLQHLHPIFCFQHRTLPTSQDKNGNIFWRFWPLAQLCSLFSPTCVPLIRTDFLQSAQTTAKSQCSPMCPLFWMSASQATK